jgi:hypothetical protein
VLFLPFQVEWLCSQSHRDEYTVFEGSPADDGSLGRCHMARHSNLWHGVSRSLLGNVTSGERTRRLELGSHRAFQSLMTLNFGNEPGKHRIRGISYAFGGIIRDSLFPCLLRVSRTGIRSVYEQTTKGDFRDFPVVCHLVYARRRPAHNPVNLQVVVAYSRSGIPPPLNCKHRVVS